jgi:hypothetical protein
MSAAVCSNFQCRGQSARSITTKPLTRLMILAALAIIVLASIRPSPDSADGSLSQPSRETESVMSGGLAFLASPGLEGPGVAAPGIKPGRPRILRITR